jgi:hypothetical protein
MKKPIKYPLHLPQSVGCVLVQKPEDLNEYLRDFLKKWPGTEFEFDGDQIIINNIFFKAHCMQVSEAVGRDYKSHKKNFD